MDASTHVNRKGEEKGEKKQQGRDDVKQGGDKGRFEGGRDSDQNRQAKGGEQRDEDKPATSEPQQTGGKGRRGAEEEE
jgi:hypothetical protein